MTHVGWRVVRAEHAAEAFDGEGARRFGGRWNSKGSAMVYTAGSLSLAAMELLVHVESERVLQRYLAVAVEFDSSLAQRVDTESLPQDWASWPCPLSTHTLGDAWAESRSSAILQVPSVIIPSENNFLINPQHPDFVRLKIRPPQPFSFDPRLLKHS